MILGLVLGELAAVLFWPRGRAVFRRHLLATRALLVEEPLRAFTGRHHPDQRRIATLEQELLDREKRAP